MKTQVPRIRAKLAVLELMAAIVGEQRDGRLFVKLVGISPKYLGCEVIQYWICRRQTAVLYGSRQESLEAEKALNGLQLSIRRDKRTAKRRVHACWSLLRRREHLTVEIEIFRQQRKDRKLDTGSFARFCKQSQIADYFSDFLLDDEKSAADVATEILVNNGTVPSERAFRHVIDDTAPLRKRHKRLLAMPVVQDFLDLPTTQPSLLSKIDIWKPIEAVELN